MSVFSRLIRFKSAQDGKVYFADAGSGTTGLPAKGTEIKGYHTFEDLKAGNGGQTVVVDKLLAPMPDPSLPIYCVGLNYRSHAAEAKLNIPQYPPLWTKPKASLADPNEDIPINKFCAQSLLDYEAELVFITSKECKDVSPSEASSYILGYTLGNDLSCRAFQAPGASGFQFFYAKAFDKFAPMGPTLVSAAEFEKQGDAVKMTAKVNGEEVQNTKTPEELIFKPAQILSHMSQGTTIPAYTAVMTGTPSGVGLFKNGGTYLKDGDVVEMELGGVGVLRNKMVFV